MTVKTVRGGSIAYTDKFRSPTIVFFNFLMVFQIRAQKMFSNKQERCSKSNPRSEIVMEHYINNSEWTSLFLSIFLKNQAML